MEDVDVLPVQGESLNVEECGQPRDRRILETRFQMVIFSDGKVGNVNLDGGTGENIFLKEAVEKLKLYIEKNPTPKVECVHKGKRSRNFPLSS